MTPGVFCAFLAETLGWPEASVAFQARRLREQGLISKGGRGNAAAHVTALDAARMLIAVSCSSAVEDTVDVVRAFGGLKEVGQRQLSQTEIILEQQLQKILTMYKKSLKDDDLRYYLEDNHLQNQIVFHFAGAPRDVGGPKAVIVRRGDFGSDATGLQGIMRARIFANHADIKPSSDDRALFEYLFKERAIVTTKTIAPSIIKKIGEVIRG
jgi:hypothetical protein